MENNNIKTTDFLVDVQNPGLFDKNIQSLGTAMLYCPNGKYIKKDGFYIMRIIGDPGFIKFAIKNQGYGQIVRELEQTN